MLLVVLHLDSHGIRSPITLTLLQDDVNLEKSFSLDVEDSVASEFVRDLLHENPRKLHALVACNPLVATRCFHWAVREVIRTLFNCDDAPGGVCDSIAARETLGIFGHVRAYLGVVEPQMRKALHMHMFDATAGLRSSGGYFP